MKKIIEKFSWEKPIELVLLEFCDSMQTQMLDAALAHRETGWFANNSLSNECRASALAYGTVKKNILREIKIRKEIKKLKRKK